MTPTGIGTVSPPPSAVSASSIPSGAAAEAFAALLGAVAPPVAPPVAPAASGQTGPTAETASLLPLPTAKAEGSGIPPETTDAETAPTPVKTDAPKTTAEVADAIVETVTPAEEQQTSGQLEADDIIAPDLNDPAHEPLATGKGDTDPAGRSSEHEIAARDGDNEVATGSETPELTAPDRALPLHAVATPSTPDKGNSDKAAPVENGDDDPVKVATSENRRAIVPTDTRLPPTIAASPVSGHESAQPEDGKARVLPEQAQPALGAMDDTPITSSRSSHIESAPALSVRSARFGEELGIAIARHASQSAEARSEILTLRLDPPEHGRIEVKLTFEDGSPLRASVLTSNPGTLDLLRRESADLFRALGQAGLDANTQSFSFDSRAQNGGQQQRSSNDSLFTTEDGVMDDFAASEETRYRSIRSAGTINLIT
ncbi:MAG: flagellar hook-length control protein FliK [Sphingobium sp.]|nr:flagellar hook-length control protein FliK [Sphingobium sp.]MCP5398522.1 flagellar hook-length control protein FliK [Sphingomonas sp.]